MRWETLLCYLVCFLLGVRCETPTYKKMGSNVTLTPGKTSGGVKSILWRLGDNLAMEYYENSGPPISYRQFQVRGSLNTDDGAMTITGLTRDDSGLYSVEINNEANKKTELMVIAPVGKPTVSTSCHEDYCNLTCEGSTEGAEPVTYIWIMDKSHTETQNKEWKITKDNNAKFIKCELENPVSSEQSDPLDNPLSSTVDPINWTGLIAGLFLILATCGIVLAVLHKTGIIRRLFRRTGPAQNPAPAVQYAAVPGKADDATNGPESVKVEQPGPSDGPTERPNGRAAVPGKADDATNGPDSIIVEQPGPSEVPTERPNETEAEVFADARSDSYENIGPAHEDQAPSGHDDSGEASSDKPGNTDAGKSDDGESAPDNKTQEDQREDTEG